METTASKGMLRITTTALGGAFAVLVMLRSPVATNPYALTAIILASNFLIALFMLSHFKYAGEPACLLDASINQAEPDGKPAS